MKPNIISEHKDYCVIHKPPNTHSTGSGSLEEQLQSELSKDTSLLQRLDYETEGLVIASRNSSFHERFLSLQKVGSVYKEYHALVEGVGVESFHSELYYGSRYRSSKKVTVKEKEFKRSRLSHTRATPLRELHGNTLVKVDINKGQRHQIRSTLAFFGYPLVGDSLYGSKSSFQELYPNEGREFFLFANRVEFEGISFKLPLPDFVS